MVMWSNMMGSGNNHVSLNSYTYRFKMSHQNNLFYRKTEEQGFDIKTLRKCTLKKKTHYIQQEIKINIRTGKA